MTLLSKHIVALSFLALALNSADAQRILDIDPVSQASAELSWVSTAEMVFKYYDVPTTIAGSDYQCGIVALAAPACKQSCARCHVDAPSLYYLAGIIRNYPTLVASVRHVDVGRLGTIVYPYTLPVSVLRADIDAGRPVIAGISPPAQFAPAGTARQHPVVLIGYESEDDTDPSDPLVIINDPFPYTPAGQFPNPYEAVGGEARAPGQYAIGYRSLRQLLHWTASMRLRCSGEACPDVSP